MVFYRDEMICTHRYRKITSWWWFERDGRTDVRDYWRYFNIVVCNKLLCSLIRIDRCLLWYSFFLNWNRQRLPIYTIWFTKHANPPSISFVNTFIQIDFSTYGQIFNYLEYSVVLHRLTNSVCHSNVLKYELWFYFF